MTSIGKLADLEDRLLSQKKLSSLGGNLDSSYTEEGEGEESTVIPTNA